MDREKTIPAAPNPQEDYLKGQIEAMKKKIEEKQKEDAVRLACDRLNAVLAHDRKAVSDLIELRVFCDKAVADTTCPAVPFDDGSGNLQIGVLGVIQALIPAEYRIVAQCGDDGLVSGFAYRKLVDGRFVPAAPSAPPAP